MERAARRNIKKSKDKSSKAKQNLNEPEHSNIEEEDYSIKKENEISEDNKELIQILTEKGYWNNLTKINSIDKTISLEDAINEVKKMDNQAFTLISGSYLLEINSKESDTDFIVILYFNYEGPVENYGTNLLHFNFMGIQSECYRASLQINYLITGSKEKFRILLLALKLWAKIWPIITPGFPKQNAGFNVNLSTRTIIWKEMKNAKQFLLKMKEAYHNYLALVCTYSSSNPYGEDFCDFSTTRIRLQLLFTIETETGAICHANLQKPIKEMQECPQEFRKKGWLCIIWLVGIDYEKSNGESEVRTLYSF
uniref:Polynucleotide adenylyltransferase n=2 Tax=Meloidogyne TaxID=189290 RepID=A0A915MG92_MELJA